MRALIALSLVTASLLLAACASPDDAATSGGPPAPSADAPAPDPAPTGSSNGRAVPPGYADALKQAIAEVDGRTGLALDFKVDTAKLEARALGLLGTGGKDADEGFDLGVRAILAAYPAGHLQIYPKDVTRCGTPELPIVNTSVVGACTQPYGDHAVVTVAGKSNPLELVAGDEILGIDDKTGPAMLDDAFARPMCRSGSPSASNRRTSSAASIFAGVQVGSKVTIKHVDGSVETKTLASLTAPASCRDPFSRGRYAAKATTQPDGTAVLHIPSFVPANADTDPAALDKFNATIRAEIEKVKSAPRLVIDVRGNSGGATPAGLAIAAGMPGAKLSEIAKCRSRKPHSTSWENDFVYTLDPSTAELTYSGKVAVLVDGNSFSATDYFARTMRLATSAVIIGRPNAGGYGGSTDKFQIETGPGLVVYPDPWRCTDSTSGEPLEGQSVKLDVEEDLSPSDLAKGIDTDVAAAIGLLTGGSK